MSNVPRPNIIWRGAHPNNFTVGRPGGGRDGRNTFHHVVGSAESAAIVFNNPGRSASAHFIVTDQPGVIFQCVDLNNTAWSDGNWDSNLKTISVEHHGDWRGGYDNPQVRENAALLCAWLRDQGLINRPIRHRDVLATTACCGDLPVEAIWNRASEIINQYNQPPTPVDNRPEWLKNRREVAGKTVYAQRAGIFVHNLNAPGEPLDTRRFTLNQNFEIKGETTAGGKEFWITRSSYDANIASGLLKSDVADTVFVPPVPQPTPAPKPVTPDWSDTLLVDEDNREMCVLRATPLIDLENGRPVLKDGKEVWFQAGDIIKDVSAHTIVAQVTYQLTEFSFQQVRAGQYVKYGNGIKASDLTIDPKACPPGTPANPEKAPEPADPVSQMPDVPTPPVVTPSQPSEPAPQPEAPAPVTPKPTTPSAPEAPKLTPWLKLLLFVYTKFILPRINAKKG